jgi:uncharacterized protein (TIRG00374 family)
MKEKYWHALIFSIGLLIGLGVFYFLLVREGISQVIENLAHFGIWPLLGFVIISLVNFCLYSKRWQMIVNAQLPADHQVSFGRIYLHRLAGYATGYLTPGTQIAGEPVRVALHVADGVPAKEATSAAVIDIAFDIAAFVVFVIAGVVLAVIEGLSSDSAALIFIGLAIALGLMIAFFWLIGSGRGFFQHLFRWSGLARIKRLKYWEEQLIATEALMSKFLAAQPWRIVRLSLISALAISFKILEVFYIAWFFGVQLNFGQAFLVSTLPGITLLLPIPGGLGLFEGGFATVFTLLSIPLDPVSFTLIIRLRDAIFIAIGVAHLTIQGGKIYGKKS